MLITKEISIDVGHSLEFHKSKCRNLHGHCYVVEVGVDDKVITKKGSSDYGMVIDFSDLKQTMMDEIDAKFDHGFVMSNTDPRKKYFEKMKEEGNKIVFVDFAPTAENLAKHWYGLLKKPLQMRKIKIHHVKIWETKSSTATYMEEN